MKKILILISTGLLLTACGPNEKEQLNNEKAKLQKEVKNIQDKLDSEKTKNVSKKNTINSLDSNLKQAKNGRMVTSEAYTQTFKNYTNNISEALVAYSSIDKKLTTSNKNVDVAQSLNDIKTDIDDAIKAYESPFKDANPPAAFEDIHSQIESANKNMKNGIDTIVKSYDDKDQTGINEGKQTLQKAIDLISGLEIK
ncbi:DUF6376 family protein [Macrococcus equi]|uniref:DUF6376 family protein n=1 Tax=Macrococcus equi TaxID=3395462 RepID=UPI0039BE9275